MKVCVVGGNGNIGFSVARELLRLGHEVVCFNRGLTGPVPDGARPILGDRRDRDAFEHRMRAERFDAAVDMSSYDREDARSSIRAFSAVGHFVQCSSVATYGREFDSFPTTEDHALRPWTDSDYGIRKQHADVELFRACREVGFPVTLIKPSITFGPKQGLIRQVGNDFMWLDRIRQGLPIVAPDDGVAVHQFMHADDAGRGFALVVGRQSCIGQSYNLVHQECTSWATYHRTAMQVIGRDVELVGVPASCLKAVCISGAAELSDVFSHNSYFCGAKFHRAVPEFERRVSLEDAVGSVYIALEESGRIPLADRGGWEDQLIAAHRAVRSQTTSLVIEPPVPESFHRVRPASCRSSS